MVSRYVFRENVIRPLLWIWSTRREQLRIPITVHQMAGLHFSTTFVCNVHRMYETFVYFIDFIYYAVPGVNIQVRNYVKRIYIYMSGSRIEHSTN